MRLRLGRLTLLGRFTLICAGIGIAFALTLGALVAQEATEAAFRESVATTAQAAEMLLTPYLVKGDLTEPLWSERINDLSRMIEPHIDHRGIVHVRLWNRKRVVVFSNNRSLIGRSEAASGNVASALAGRLVATIDQRPADGPSSATSSAGVLKVYVPIRLLGENYPQGVYEVHRLAEPIVTNIKASRARMWLLVTLGTAGLYLSLVSLVRRASRELIEQQRALEEALEGTIRALAVAVDARDTYTGGHSSQVAVYAVAIATDLGLSKAEVHIVKLAGYLHDVGKIGVSDDVLRKTGELSDSEVAMIRQHSLIGFQILEPVKLDLRIKLAVKHAHERWDGLGYPDGLAGEAIPIHARILAVADAFEAMTTTRPYRDALGVEVARAELRRLAGHQFDPRVVEAFLASQLVTAEAPLPGQVASATV
jgi:putative nucleotidyltransferase with HDIG domain